MHDLGHNRSDRFRRRWPSGSHGHNQFMHFGVTNHFLPVMRLVNGIRNAPAALGRMGLIIGKDFRLEFAAD